MTSARDPNFERMRKEMVRAIADYQMIEAGDRIMVGVSGGKDSSLLLFQLLEIQKRAPFKFSIYPVMLDQKQPGFNSSRYEAWVSEIGAKLTVIGEDTYSIVKEKIPEGKTFCSLCSRLRRGVLYNYAWSRGYNKIALGHHRDDLNQTLLLNMFYSGSLAAMPPKLNSDDGRNIIIRPLAYVPEAWISAAAETLSVPIMPCNLCGSQEGLKRKKMAQLLVDLEQDIPHVASSLLKAQQNIRPSQLSDRSLWRFSKDEPAVGVLAPDTASSPAAIL